MRRWFSLIGVGLASLLSAPAALAVVLPPTQCAPAQNGQFAQFGCGAGGLSPVVPSNVIWNALVGSQGIAVTLLQVSAGMAVLYIIWAGFQMVISMGEEGKLSQYKWGIAYALIGLSVSILSQFVISTVGTQNYGQQSNVQNLPINLLSSAALILRVLLNAVFVIIMVVAGLKMLYAQGKADDFNTGKKMLTWALIGAVIVNLSAALVTAVAQFFGIN